MKYFVTGATGFVGGAVVIRLLAAGHQVVAVVRDPHKAAALAQAGVELHQGDVTEKETMRRPMAGVDGVFHIAGWYKIGVRHDGAGQRINVDGTRNVLELMRELGIPRGVYTSTLAVNSDTHGRTVDEDYHFSGEHLSEYDRTKAAAHALAEQFIDRGLPLVVVMPGLIYGPGDTSSVRNTWIQYLQRQLPVIPQGTGYCWGYIDDIASAHLLAMEAGRPGRYMINGPQHTLVEALQLAQQITGIPAPRSAPAGMFAAMSNVAGVLEKVLPLPPLYTREGLRVIAGVTYYGDTSKARQELGYAPRPLREGLEITLQHEMKLLGMG